MAKLILIQREDNPDNNAGASVFAYFDGTPSKADLGAATEAHDGFTVPVRCDTELSRRASLQRWLLTQAV